MVYGSGWNGHGLHEVLAILPFFGLNVETGKAQLNVSRLLEGIVVASVVGAVSVYGSQQAVEGEIKSVKQEVKRIRQRLNQIEGDVYIPRSQYKDLRPQVPNGIPNRGENP